MTSDAPTAAWHPALMPNSNADITPIVDIAEPQQPSSPPLELPDPAQIEAATQLKPIDTSEDGNSGVDEWFPDYEAGSPWKPEEERQEKIQEQREEVTEVEDIPPTAPQLQTGPNVEPEPLQSELYQELAPSAQHEEHLDEVPTEYGDDASAPGATLAPEETIMELQPPPAQQEEHLGEVPAEHSAAAPVADVVETPVEPIRDAQPPSGPKHVSNDSFARTISQQPNWMDDDEPTWSPPPAEADPFRFMPLNERTNSFPVVPPFQHSNVGIVEPLPSNQVEEMINEIEHESESFDFDQNNASQASNALQQDNFWGDDGAEAEFPTQVGGDLQGPEEEASDARYAEGLPLINHEQDKDTEEQREIAARDLFAQDENVEGDDFFTQIGGNADTSEQQEFLPSHLERKSTTQFTNGLSGNDTRSATVILDDELKEEDEFLDNQPVAEHEADTTAEEVGPAADTAVVEPHEGEGKGEDLAAKWSEAFAGDDDDDFLLEDEPAAGNKDAKALDPSAFFIDDDEGFLEDSEEPLQHAQPSTSLSRPVSSQPTSTSNKYLPATQPTPTHPSNPYFPTASPMIPQAQTLPAATPLMTPNPYAAQTQQQPLSSAYGAPAPRPAVSKAQSFADKSKGGYHSPYDLPMEVVKPRKRPSQQQLPRGAAAIPSGPPAPPRSASTYSQGPPAMHNPLAQAPPQGPAQPQSSESRISPPASNHSGQSPSLAKPPQSKTGFFEDLPMSHKPRPASRTSSKTQPSSSQAGFNGPPQSIQPPHVTMPTPPQELAMASQPPGPDIARLVPPAPVNPYSALPAGTSPASAVPPPSASRYSPATSQGAVPNGAIPPPSRYSPAPPAQRAPSYGPGPNVTSPPVLPHLPRTSSPLAHFEARPAVSHPEPTLHQSRSNSSLYEPRLNKMSSLPPTREVEEEETTAPQDASQLPPRAPQNLPPLGPNGASTISIPKRKIAYGPISTANDIIPPPRSQTGSPGAMYGLRSPIKASEIAPRPLSAQGAPSPALASNIPPLASIPAASSRPRGMSQKLNLIPPTDGRELDPLQRWKGAPLISWGVGGTFITSFPVDVPRYGMNQPGPMIVRSPGEVKVKTIKEVQPLEERLAKFPGPLKGKSKKKEATSWLTAGIEELEKGLPNLAFQPNLSHEDKRAVERALLWKVLRVMVENDGILEGNATVEKAVRDILSLAPTGHDEIASPIYAGGNSISGFAGESSATQMQSDSVDSGTIQQLKKSLLVGDREKAVWDAADKRLWGHALLIANTVSPELYHKVSQEFIKKEVNFPSHNNESLAALYAVLSGNHAESVDELVPMHARAGLQMVASSTGPANSGGLEGLEKWRETLTLILSNRSTGDVQALNALGNLLSGYGRAEAAHICFIFARSAAVFGGLDDPKAQFVLVGADHRTQSQQFFKETEAFLLSEVYEYGLSLTGAPSVASGVPHLAVYKLQHAMTLAEHGYRDKAIQYCDIILKDMSAQTRRSPYYHPLLESAAEDLRERILQAPNKEASNSWISKPNMNKVSDTMWSRFNKFVAGDDVDAPGQGSPKFGEESGPFAKYAGGTPTISRPASASNATGMEMFGTPNGYGVAGPSLGPTGSPVLTRASSRYAPMAGQASTAAASPYEPNSTYSPMGRSSMERTSGEYSRSPYEPRHSSDVPAGPIGGYMPNNAAAPVQSYSDPALGIANQSPYHPAPPPINTANSASGTQISDPKTPSFPHYTPFSQGSSPYAPATNNTSPYAPAAPVADDNPTAGDGQDAPVVGYQPLSYGYEPPSTHTTEDELAHSTEEQVPSGEYGGYEPPSYGYEPPSYQPDIETNNDSDDNGDEPKPKKKSFMDDDDDDYPSMSSSKAAEKSKAEKDRENEELFRKAAEEDGKLKDHLISTTNANSFLAKRAEEEKAAKGKKGWGFGSWFAGGGPKKESLEGQANKPIRAKLGEKSSFVYDPEQKRWVNKAAGAEDTAPKSATPPPPRGTPRPGFGTPPPPGPSVPPPRTGSAPMPFERSASPVVPGPAGSVPPPMMRSVSTASSVGPGGPLAAPPSRPATSMSNASSIDDLLGAAVPRKGGSARGKKKGGGRYIDVMAK